MLQVYDCIAPKPEKRAVADHYTRDTLLDKLVLFDMDAKKYRVVYHADYANWLLEQQSAPHYHEVIFGNMRQKIKLDIDARYDGDFTPHLNSIIDCFSDALAVAFAIDPVIRVYSSTDDMIDSTKYSYHVVCCNCCVDSNRVANAFYDVFRGYLHVDLHNYIDWGVNKSTQCLRLIGSAKDGRVKSLVGSEMTMDTVLESMITYTFELQVVSLAIDETAEFGFEASSSDVERAVTLLAPHASIHKCEFRCERGSLLIYDRYSPAHCEWCQRTHDADNTFMGCLVRAGDVISVYKMCRRHKGNTKVGEFVTSASEVGLADAIKSNQLNVVNTKVVYSTYNTALDNMIPSQRTVYCEAQLRPFEMCNTLFVKAAMKMGKTKNLLNYLADHFPSGVATPRVLFMSFRQTFSGNIKGRFPDFQLYNDIKGSISADRVICQIESLYRIKCTERYALVILDESESIIEQITSGLGRNRAASMAAFKWLVQTADHVICMDAGMSDRTYRVITDIRGKVGCHYHNNTYQNATDDNYHFTTNHSTWLEALCGDLDNGKRIAIPTNSLTEARGLNQMLADLYPALKVGFYNSETASAIKREHFADVDNAWSQYDVLIYTPTITAGVSFEVAHYNRVYAYFTDMSCGVESAIQMLGRIRCVIDKHYCICFNVYPVRLPTTVEDCKLQLYRSRASLLAKLTDDGLSFDYSETGEVKFYESTYFKIWLENKCVANLSRSDYMGRMLRALRYWGAQCTVMENIESTGRINAFKSATELAAQRKSEAVASAPTISDEQAKEITDRIRANEDVTVAQRNSLEHYRFCKLYGVQSVDPATYGVYGKRETIRVYKNLQRVADLPIQVAIAKIKQEEATHYNGIMELTEEHQNSDIARRYVFEQHRVALSQLAIAGYTQLTQRGYVAPAEALQRLLAQQCEVATAIQSVAAEFRISFSLVRWNALKTVEDEYMDYWLKATNKILKVMYDLKITKKDGLWRLQDGGLFKFTNDKWLIH